MSQALLPFEITSNVPIDLTLRGKHHCMEAESNNSSYETHLNKEEIIFE